MSAPEPYDVILALRECHFASADELHAWSMAPNPDLGGLSPALVLQRGRYDDVIEAIQKEQQRRQRPQYREVT